MTTLWTIKRGAGGRAATKHNKIIEHFQRSIWNQRERRNGGQGGQKRREPRKQKDRKEAGPAEKAWERSTAHHTKIKHKHCAHKNTMEALKEADGDGKGDTVMATPEPTQRVASPIISPQETERRKLEDYIEHQDE